MASVTEHLEQLQQLTQQNLDILKTLNESFYTNKEHLSVNTNNTTYVIPSFMALENKINYLQEGFENLISAPENGEAHFNLDGNSRSIEVRKYTQAPNSVSLSQVSNFDVETNDIFKDFLTPNPYVHFDLKEIPNDITSVIIKKIIPVNETLISTFEQKLSNSVSKPEAYKDLYKLLSLYIKDVDYIEYDTIKKLPVRKQIGAGVYVIQEITSNYTDNNLDQIITFKLRNDLTSPEYINNLSYRLFDETIEKRLKAGDELVSYNGKTKLKILELLPASNSITVKILNGEYLNLEGCGNINEQYITQSSKLKFYAPIDFDEDKYVKVSLEEDKYIYVAIAPLNDRMNIQAPWGTGLYINTSKLINKDKQKFQDFYEQNIQNIGDVLNEISSMIYNPITKINPNQFDKIVKLKPELNEKNLQVIQLNSHLNNNKTIQEIRSLYSQKLKYKNELTSIQIDIENYNQQLSTIAFDDVTNTRSGILIQIDALNKRKNELITSLTKVINNISMVANNSEVPIENAKYRIRGFFDYKKFAEENNLDKHIIGINVQYRYKNSTIPQGSSLSMNNGDFLFSDWQDMKSFTLQKEPKFNDTYKFEYPEDNSTKNEPSFNQIDIPITQGESVDIRLKVVYDFGYPFVQATSNWSEILNVSFPQELLKNVEILTIIEENNNDIETNRFSNILIEEGIPAHVDDKIIDQDITYFHKPENIASGFYTTERRIIPLKDKLSEMDKNIADIMQNIENEINPELKIYAEIAGNKQQLVPFDINNIPVESYNTFFNNSKNPEGAYTVDEKIVSVVINLIISNPSNKSIKLYPLFPGGRDVLINDVVHSKFNKNDYSWTNDDGKYGVGMKLNGQTPSIELQTANQFITFRKNNITDNKNYYDIAILYKSPNMQAFNKYGDKNGTLGLTDNNDYQNIGACLYPVLKNKYSLCIPSDSNHSYYQLKKDETIIIPLVFEYNLNDSLDSISKTMTFDIRTSLYTDPVNYIVQVTAKKQNSILDNIFVTDKADNYSKYKIIAKIND